MNFFEDSLGENVPGLKYTPGYITDEQHARLIHAIDSNVWSEELSRRVQQYGFRYDYRRSSKDLQPTTPFPRWAKNLAGKIQEDEKMLFPPDQLIINEYLPGQGISPHIDREDLFGERILSVSLGSTCVMEMTHQKTRQKIQLLLEPKSLLMLSGDSRHEWQHAIPQRKVDDYRGRQIPRKRRISLTFRTTK